MYLMMLTCKRMPIVNSDTSKSYESINITSLEGTGIVGVTTGVFFK
jgi:hypothetical protein